QRLHHPHCRGLPYVIRLLLDPHARETAQHPPGDRVEPAVHPLEKRRRAGVALAPPVEQPLKFRARPQDLPPRTASWPLTPRRQASSQTHPPLILSPIGTIFHDAVNFSPLRFPLRHRPDAFRAEGSTRFGIGSPASPCVWRPRNHVRLGDFR